MYAILNIVINSFVLFSAIVAGDLSEDKIGDNLNIVKNFESMPKIGIIGGGIGGAATSYFLRNAFKANALLHIYEANQVGGRLALSSKFDVEYETGGSIIHPKNQYMNNFVQLLGLQKSFGCPSKFGIFDGKDYSILESSWSWMNVIKFFWRYGFDIYRLKSLTSKTLKSFSRIYDLQNVGTSFTTVEDLLYSMDPDFPSLLNKTTRSYLKELEFRNLIIDELVTACTRANYGQLPDINAFVGSVSVAAASPDLWSVVGGNRRVPAELIKYSNATLIPRSVSSVSKMQNGQFRVWSKPIESTSTTEDAEKFVDYDAVIVATPLTKDMSSIRFVNFSENFQFPGTYERILCTLVKGDLNPTTFKFKEIDVKIDEILTDNPALLYNSVGRQFSVNKGACDGTISKVYKVFSPNILTEEILASLFDRISKVEVKEWRAYPHYTLNAFNGRFELTPGLYYNNAIEQAASAMEMSAIAAKNSALLVERYITKKNPLKIKKNKDEL